MTSGNEDFIEGQMSLGKSREEAEDKLREAQSKGLRPMNDTPVETEGEVSKERFLIVEDDAYEWSLYELQPPYRGYTHVADLECDDVTAQRIGAVLNAACTLIERIDEIHEHPKYKGVWSLAMIHGMEYDGPTYEEELSALRRWLPVNASEPSDSTQETA